MKTSFPTDSVRLLSPRLQLQGPLMLAALMLLPGLAHASGGSFDVPFITTIGCQVVSWMKGPLAILIFVVSVIAALVIGMIAKMDWSKIINIAVIFGIVTAIGGFLANSQYVQTSPALAACLR